MTGRCEGESGGPAVDGRSGCSSAVRSLILLDALPGVAGCTSLLPFRLLLSNPTCSDAAHTAAAGSADAGAIVGAVDVAECMLTFALPWPSLLLLLLLLLLVFPSPISNARTPNFALRPAATDARVGVVDKSSMLRGDVEGMDEWTPRVCCCDRCCLYGEFSRWRSRPIAWWGRVTCDWCTKNQHKGENRMCTSRCDTSRCDGMCTYIHREHLQSARWQTRSRKERRVFFYK